MDITIKKAELCQITDYQTFKETLGAELRASAEGFVRIGYLLKQARDTDILHESGYKNLTEFAQAEYGLTKDIVSRYIAINDKYSESGYSDQLREEFRGFGVAKLAEMLTLPESVVEEMRPELTKNEIRELKEAVKEEEKISDIEVAIEAAEVKEETPEVAEMNILERALVEVFRSEPEHYCRIREYIMNDLPDVERRFVEELAPAGYMIYTVRAAGVGTLMVKLDESMMTITNIRSGEKHSFSYQVILSTESSFICGDPADKHEQAWTRHTGMPFPEKKTAEKEKVAPAQPKKEHVRTVKPKNETPKAEKPKEEPKKKPKEEEKKGMVKDPYWKELGEEVKREKIAEDGAEHSDKLSEDSEAEHNVEEMVQDVDKLLNSNDKSFENAEKVLSNAEKVLSNAESGNEEAETTREPYEYMEQPEMPKHIARERCKGWIEDIVRSSEEMRNSFDYENYALAITAAKDIEKEIFEIEKLLRKLKRISDEYMDGSDTR